MDFSGLASVDYADLLQFIHTYSMIIKILFYDQVGFIA